MASWRARESAKQLRCRDRNEATAQARRAGSPEGIERTFQCECSDPHCNCPIALTVSEYELVRQHATHFAVARNHENPESEHVIQEDQRFAIVELVTAEATKLARRSDPRQQSREKCWPKTARSRRPGKGR